MEGVPAQFDSPVDRAEFRRPPHRAGIELYRAHIVRHAFEPHAHGGFGIGAIDAGVERFRYAGSDHLAPPQALVLMNPDVLHTGRAETPGGWRYRMAYLDADLLGEVAGESGWWFPDAVLPAAAAPVSAALHGLWSAADPLAFDGALGRLVLALRRHARSATAPRPDAAHRFVPVLDWMRAHLGRRVLLADLAAVAGLSPFHFQRAFQAQLHATPHQVLMALRLDDAKRRLAAGEPPAQVAAACGLADQAHLTRAFARRYGTTPAHYQRAVRA